MTVKRYDFGTERRGNTGVPGIVGKVDGRYVLYEDYLALKAAQQPAAAAQETSAPNCPFPCGWEHLHKLAVQDAAYLARQPWPDDEEGVSVPRATTMRCLDNLIQVCRAMLAAAPTPPADGQEHACDVTKMIRETPCDT